jgi:hypothetical protein
MVLKDLLKTDSHTVVSFTYNLNQIEWYHNTYWRKIQIPLCATPIVYIKQNGIITLTGDRFTYRRVLHL